MQQQIPFRRPQFGKADLQVLPTNLLNLLSTGLFRQQIPNVIGEDQRAPSHPTPVLQGLKPGDREQPTTKRCAHFKIIEFPPRNQARFLCDLFNIIPCRQQSAQKRTNTRLVLHQKSHKSFVPFVVVHRDSFFRRLIVQDKRILPQVENLDRKTLPSHAGRSGHPPVLLGGLLNHCPRAASETPDFSDTPAYLWLLNHGCLSSSRPSESFGCESGGRTGNLRE